jgi:hypothetical protein
MDQDQSKTCKMCFQQIDARARKCPYCHHWQSRWASLTAPGSPGMALIVLVPIFLGLALMGWFFERMFDRGKDFQAYRGEIEVVQSEVKFGQDKDGPTVAVVGVVRNNSNVTWKEVQFAVQFFDKEKKLVDAAQKHEYFFVFPATDRCAFKVSFGREFPESQYVTHEVRVVSAKDSRARF